MAHERIPPGLHLRFEEKCADMKLIAVKLDEQLMEMLNEAARREDVSKSQLIRDALARYLCDFFKTDRSESRGGPENLKVVC